MSLLALAASAAAQYPNISGYRLHSTVPWETDVPGAEFKALQAGKLRSATPRDVVALRGSELYMLANMAGRDYPLRLAEEVTGMALLTDMGPAQSTGGNLDALLVVTGSGASLWTWNGTDYTSTALPQLASWAGASELKRGPGGTLFARSAAGTSILRASYGGGLVSALSALSVTGGVQDYEPMFWDTDAVVDLAVIAGTEIYVRSTASWSGSLVPMSLAAGPRDLLAVSHGTAGERDLLVVYAEVGGSGYLTAGNSGRIDTTFALNTTLGGLESFAFDRVTGGVVREDLFLSLAASRDVVQFQRLAPQPAGSQSFWLPTANGVPLSYVIENDGELTTTPTQGTRTFGHDVDGDGDQDVLLGLSNPGELQVLLNERLERFDVVCPDVVPEGLEVADAGYNFPWVGKFQYARRNPDATHLRLEVRCQLNTGSSYYDPAGKSLFATGQNNEFIAPGTWELPLLPAEPNEPYSNYSFTLNAELTDTDGNSMGVGNVGRVYQYTFYEITKDASGNVVQEFPSVTFFHSFSALAEFGYLSVPEIRQYHPNAPTEPPFDFAVGSGGTVIGGRGLSGP